MKKFRTAILYAIAFACLQNGPASFGQGAFPGTGSKTDWLKANGPYAEGNILSEKKKYGEAIAKYQQAIAIYPHDFHYHYNLGLALKKNHDLTGATEAFRKALALNGNHWQSWKALGNCLYQSGDMKEARTAFECALSANPPAAQAADLHKAIAACSSKI